jgi:hypothetical protein
MLREPIAAFRERGVWDLFLEWDLLYERAVCNFMQHERMNY